MKKTKNKKKETVLVTGGAGFIGSHLCESLHKKGYKIVCVDNLFAGSLENIKSLEGKKNFEFLKLDVNDYDEIKQAFKDRKIDYIFHYANIMGVKRVIEDPIMFIDDISGTRNILKLAKKHKVKKVAYSSSSEAYGEPVELPMREEGKHNPGTRDIYALAKLLSENLMQIYNDKYNLPTVVFRFFNVYGPRQNNSAYGGVTSIFVKQVLEGKSPIIFGEGFRTRDFIYIEDNVEASIELMLNKKTNGQTINIGVGMQTTILELAEKIIRLSGKKLKPKMVKERKVDIDFRSPDVKKMRKYLKYKFRYNLDEGLRKTLDFYRKNAVKSKR